MFSNFECWAMSSGDAHMACWSTKPAATTGETNQQSAQQFWHVFSAVGWTLDHVSGFVTLLQWGERTMALKRGHENDSAWQALPEYIIHYKRLSEPSALAHQKLCKNKTVEDAWQMHDNTTLPFWTLADSFSPEFQSTSNQLCASWMMETRSSFPNSWPWVFHQTQSVQSWPLWHVFVIGFNLIWA
jgi:hypothetical protein